MLTINLFTEHSSDGWSRDTRHIAEVTVYRPDTSPERRTFVSNVSKMRALEEVLKDYGLDIRITKSSDRYVSY